MTVCKSFLPLINGKSEILILGSMPGVKSLEEHQYYAHSQNRFWKLIGLLCNYTDLYKLKYDDKIQVFLDNNFALWDVIRFCERNGSLDSNIQNETPNKIPELLKKYKNIKTICLNGNKAYSAFKKYFPETAQSYKCYKLPSTSPANARFNLKDLYNEWCKIL